MTGCQTLMYFDIMFAHCVLDMTRFHLAKLGVEARLIHAMQEVDSVEISYFTRVII